VVLLFLPGVMIIQLVHSIFYDWIKQVTSHGYEIPDSYINDFTSFNNTDIDKPSVCLKIKKKEAWKVTFYILCKWFKAVVLTADKLLLRLTVRHRGQAALQTEK